MLGPTHAGSPGPRTRLLTRRSAPSLIPSAPLAGDTSSVSNLAWTFGGAASYTGGGLSTWKTPLVATLAHTFDSAGEMNADLSGWDVGNVNSMYGTFNAASKFIVSVLHPSTPRHPHHAV